MDDPEPDPRKLDRLRRVSLVLPGFSVRNPKDILVDTVGDRDGGLLLSMSGDGGPNDASDVGDSTI